MSIYDESAFPVSDEIASVHATQLRQLGEPGTWGTGTQRIAVAAQARQAGYAAGVLEQEPGSREPEEIDFPAAVRDFIRKLAVAPKDVVKSDYEEVRASGLSDEEYVEIVGIVSRATNVDIFARGIGVPLQPLPEPQPGQPSRERPPEAIPEHAWVPTIPNGAAGGEIGEELYQGKPKPYIIRGLSLVPDELRRHVTLEYAQYLPIPRILDMEYSHHTGLTRPQVEVVAGRVSSINECFF